ncbi:glutamate synthase subunit GltD [Azospirillaceae bacterium]
MVMLGAVWLSEFLGKGLLMAQTMLKFVHVGPRQPGRRDPMARRKDFQEIYARFDGERAAEQAGRCSQCGIPFCHVHCPVQNNIPDWLKLTAEGRLEEAYEVSAATNNFPEICGRICPQDRLCEGNCVIEQSNHGAVTIGSVEKYITDEAWERGWVKPIRPLRELEQSVGIIGGGPAGLATAAQLRRHGYQVHVYDRHDRIGGLLIYGIPGFKLEKTIVERRVQHLLESGVHFHVNFEVGRDADLAALRARHSAVLIATGVYKAREATLPGNDLDGVVSALDYLIANNRQNLGDAVPAFDDGRLNAAGKHVVVIGGGDTAMDCVRTAVRQGAKSVKCLYRRNRANMPGSQREVQNAEEEGVEFVWQAAPEAFLGEGRIIAVRAVKIHLGVADGAGRLTPQPVPESAFSIDCDLAIKALGFEPEDLPRLFGAPELKTRRDGTVAINAGTLMTSLEGVFAAGDIVRGASLVVWAIRDGRDVAAAIHRFLQMKLELSVAGFATTAMVS